MMKKKLQIIRVDNDLVQKANLQIGNNFIGRGAATGCNEGQVLKYAVIINLSPSDEMTITPVAQCYMKPAGCVRWQSLKLGNKVPIKPGDICSLLPDKCWFKIISVPEMMETTEEKDQTLKRKAEDLENEADSKKVCLSSSAEAIVSPSETLNSILNDKDLSGERHSSSMNGNGEHRDTTPPILQEIYSTSAPEGSDIPATCSKMSLDSQDVIDVSSSIGHESEKQKEKNINLMDKAVADNESEKRIKWDCGAHFSDQTEDQASSNGGPPRSPVASRQDPISVPTPESVPTPNDPKREKCIYGTRCYRKNPNHKNNYSHPGDADYDEVDDREECPYGVKCYRKNPQHKAQFKHTSAPRRRRRAATPMQSVGVDTTSVTDASSAEESVDESDYEPSVYTESSDTRSDWDSGSEWEDGTTG